MSDDELIAALERLLDIADEAAGDGVFASMSEMAELQLAVTMLTELVDANRI